MELELGGVVAKVEVCKTVEIVTTEDEVFTSLVVVLLLLDSSELTFFSKAFLCLIFLALQNF